MPVKNPFKHWQTAVVNAFKVKRQQTKSAMHRIRIVSPSQNCQQIFRFGSARVPAGTVIKYHGQRTQLLKQTARSVFQNTQGRFLAHFSSKGAFSKRFSANCRFFSDYHKFPEKISYPLPVYLLKTASELPCRAWPSTVQAAFLSLS